MQTNALVQPVQGQLIQPLMELEMSPPIGLRERIEWLMSPCVAEGTPPQGCREQGLEGGHRHRHCHQMAQGGPDQLMGEHG